MSGEPVVVARGDAVTIVVDQDTAYDLIDMVHDAAPGYAHHLLDEVNATIGQDPYWMALDAYSNEAATLARLSRLACELDRVCGAANVAAVQRKKAEAAAPVSDTGEET